MLRWTFYAAIATIGMPIVGGAADLSDDQIRQRLIAKSIASYSGNCPCPYNLDRRGHSCGRRSAYSKQGGYAPLCYPADVSKDMIERYRRSQ
jgi:hypothetical protein